MTNRITDFQDGVTYATAAVLNGEWDNIYTGTIDRTGGRWGSLTDIPVTFGNSQNSQIVFSAANSCLAIGVDMANRRLLICDKDDVTTVFGYGGGLDPHIIIHSADGTVAEEYLLMAHDGSNAIIRAGSGGVYIQSGSATVGAFTSTGLLMIDDVPVLFGSSSDAAIEFTTDQTVDCLAIALDTTSRMLLVCDQGDQSHDFGFAARTNPCIIVVDETATNNYIEYASNKIKCHDVNVAHGFTIFGETTAYGILSVIGGGAGGLAIQGMTESTRGLILAGNTNVSDTTKSTAADASVYILGAGRSGTSRGPLSANANLVVIAHDSTARFIFDVEGDAHADVQWTTYDDFDDVQLINDLERGITQGFGEMLTYNRDAVERAGIAHFDDKPNHAFVNFTRLQMLICGALKQTNERISRLEQRLLEK